MRGGKFQLDVIRIAEGEHIDAKGGEIYNVAMWDALFVEEAYGLFEIAMARHAEAEVIKSNTVLAEAIIFDGLAWIGGGANGQKRGAIVQNRSGSKVGYFLEA